MRLRYGWLLLLFFYGGLVSGQDLQDLGMSIEAQDRFEWKRKDNLYIMEGNVILRRGQASFHADKVLVFYDEKANTSSDLLDDLIIREVVFEGSVAIVAQNANVSAEKITYDVPQNYLYMNGRSDQPVRIEVSDEIEMVSQTLEYWVSEKRLVADGDIKVMMNDMTFHSNFTQIFLQESPDGMIVVPDNWFGQGQTRLNINRIEAEGDITANMVGAEISGDKGVFTLDDMTVELCGTVVVNWQRMKLSGDCSVVDLTTQNVRFYNMADGDDAVKMSVPLSAFGE